MCIDRGFVSQSVARPLPNPPPLKREREQVARFIESARNARRIPLPRSGGG